MSKSEFQALLLNAAADVSNGRLSADQVFAVARLAEVSVEAFKAGFSFPERHGENCEKIETANQVLHRACELAARPVE